MQLIGRVKVSKHLGHIWLSHHGQGLVAIGLCLGLDT